MVYKRKSNFDMYVMWEGLSLFSYTRYMIVISSSDSFLIQRLKEYSTAIMGGLIVSLI